MDDAYFMKIALDLARKGQGYTSPNPMVGAVIVNDGEIVGRGYHQSAGKAHAEVIAIEDAGAASKNATLYVTLEPCNHTGRTPPCTERILEAGIKRVVVAMQDPNPHVKGGGMQYLSDHDVDITPGILEAEAQRLNEVFVKFIRTKRPFVILKCAATLDGQMASRTGDSKWVTGTKARQHVHRLRHAVDAIMVGIGTIKMDDPRLTTRIDNRSGRDPVRIVLDTHLSVPENAKVVQQRSRADTLVVTGEVSAIPALAKKKAFLEEAGVRVMEAAVNEDGIDLEALMIALGKRDITSLLIEGGGQVIASSLAAGIVDKIAFFYAPKIYGGNDGVSICNAKGPALMRDAVPVKDLTVQRFGDDILLEGYV